ncbi:hypothetical protein AVEN_195443-1 [Araneus ventricosus]|uniref:C2H2-type domain-containing protein n=1 Tax=Araneus ventricosus TaxID=182803 RepID=A0A4Y2I217_ARAVE|nr:hypothetical protein AVEN_195443-1 [Araneus ventricosus]
MSTSNMTVSSMAEELSQQTLMVNKHVPVVDGISKDELSADLSEKGIISGEVLQPCVNETEEYDQNVFEQNRNIILQENIHHLSDHSYIHTAKSPTFDSMNTQDLNSVGSPIVSDKEINKNLESHNLPFESDKCASDLSGNHLKSLTLSEDNEINLNNEPLTFNTVEGNCSENIYANETVVSSNPLIISENPVSSSNSSSHTATALPSSSASSNFTLSNLKLLTTKKTSAPLGSVENPIQITHKGDSFETTQVLTQAQLQQISYVLQNQRANRIQNGGRSVLFDPTTNTRIVCRIVHPSELQGTNSNAETASKPNAVRRASSSSRGKGRHRRTDDEDKGNPYLTKEEREERKKHRPRTRSGRICKPPSYMVKDYKRIHHLDFDEDVYDSDGGYSDYHVSEEETGKSGSKEEGLPPGVTTSKQRNYACQKCPKAYIGKGGLSRHYRLNPSHGTDENSSSSLASSVLSSSGGQNNSQNGTNSFPQAPVRFEAEGTLEKSPQLLSTSQANAILSARRKSRLKEILKGYSEKELIDVVLPDLAQRVSLWDFFLKKCDEKSDGLRIYEMLKEFEKFLVEMQKISHAHLSPASYEDHGKTIINSMPLELHSSEILFCLEP